MPAKKKPITDCPHTEAEHWGRGMCRHCYDAWRRSQSHVREQHRKSQKQYSGSEKGKETAKRYEATSGARERFKRYHRKRRGLKIVTGETP